MWCPVGMDLSKKNGDVSKGAGVEDLKFDAGGKKILVNCASKKRDD